MLALARVHVDELELDLQLAQRPEHADRTRGREPVELHGVTISFGPGRNVRATDVVDLASLVRLDAGACDAFPFLYDASSAQSGGDDGRPLPADA
jgi:hypothetical protein